MISRKDILEVAKKLPRDRRNKACKYTDENGEHCLVGEIMVAYSLRLPPDNGGILGNLNTKTVMARELDEYFTALDYDARHLLMNMQMTADGSRTKKPTWGEVVDSFSEAKDV